MRKDIHNSDVPNLCQACEARHRGICGALTSEQLVALARTTSKRRLSSGEELVGEAEAIGSYANVMSGVVKLSKMLPDGRHQIVGLQFAPDFLGRPFRSESAVTAEAATDVDLCAFPKTALERMMTSAPDLEHRLLEQTLKELDQARDWMVTLGRKTAAEKVASFLLMIARHIDPSEGPDHVATSFDLPLSRADIADFLGLTIETVSRQLTKLRTGGVIRIENNRRIVVANVKVLEARAGD